MTQEEQCINEFINHTNMLRAKQLQIFNPIIFNETSQDLIVNSCLEYMDLLHQNTKEFFPDLQ